MPNLENPRFIDPESRILQATRRDFNRVVGPTRFDDPLTSDYLELITAEAAYERIENYSVTGILPDEVFEEFAGDFLQERPANSLHKELITLRIVSDMVGFHRNGWIYRAHRDKEKNFSIAKLAHEAVIILDTMAHAGEKRTEGSDHILGEGVRALGEIYRRRYEMLAQKVKDSDLDIRYERERERFEMRTSVIPVEQDALRDLFEEFVADNRSYGKSF
ncbi:MAG: hypothetical protein AAB521_03830 [Patescibacteria group bacterium]